ncbi:SH3 domain-containing protein [Bacillus sp. ISL-40]|uniref:SH3 domain-containing protein n=1 Tax=unclassified Bacillus (in: firmicutes) TaxID=185979 RepID=UPI001BEAF8BD|nr:MULTISPECIES: SH3 domain-containing protein [unclassified Bacillus (in: firmicutes)]MBT2701129.1 SH3 domain-containing protein [Bacillus sp. ISL-40]MBT2721055.1 SH3 domain-containing protein [Bacillus sp. ISL-46]MBT2739110.1 SH3 domain-containing protein [Bacillus sp. ISL-77]
MESILNLLFWIWSPISVLPEWLRIFLALFVLLQLARLILLYIFPPLLNLLCHLLKKMFYLISYPIMALIYRIQKKRREAGKAGIPVWINIIEGMFALFENFFNKMIQLFMKRKRDKTRIKRWTFYSATALVILLTAAIINNSNEWYTQKWKKAEVWLNQEHVHIQASGASPDQKELILNKKYEDGGNIREAPTLTAPRLYTITNGELMHFLNEEQVDSKGIKWLKVQTANGIEGWISALIVREK